MANGRLGKASVAVQDTVAVYTNSSGAEASVSLIATSIPNGTLAHFRIDSTTDALKTTTVIVSAAFQDEYLNYIVKNTNWDDTTAPALVGRIELGPVTQLNAAWFNGTSTSESYTVSDFTYAPPITYEAAVAHGSYIVRTASSLTRQITPSGTEDLSDWYSAMWGYDTAAANRLYNQANVEGRASNGMDTSLSYSDRGQAFDPYTSSTISVNNGGRNSMKFVKDNVQVTGSSTSDSIWYQGISTSISAAQSDYQTMRLQNGCWLMDGGPNSAKVLIGSNFEPSVDDDWTNSSNADYFSIATSTAITRGNVAWFEYKPSEDSWYVGFRDSSAGIYACRFTRAGFEDNTGSPSGLSRVSNNVTFGWTALGAANITAQTAGQFTANTWRYTSLRIGLSQWVLYGSNDTDYDIWITDDLIEWKTVSDYYGATYDYSSQISDVLISQLAGNTTVNAVKSDIVSLGQDGILEQDQSMVQYERSGLVLNNGDRVLAYNRGTNPLVVQVMGYEGS